MEKGSLVVEEVTIDAKTELISKLAFSKEGDHWESTPNQEGDVVVAVDCTQDEAILAAGKSRELINHIQQLRKSAGLDLTDIVEVFFQEEGITSTESAVALNVSLFENKFRGSVPLPKNLAPEWSVVIRSDSVEVGGSKVDVFICRPAVSARDGLDELTASFLSTVDPSQVQEGQVLSCVIDGKDHSLEEGKDFWVSASKKAAALKSVSWM